MYIGKLQKNIDPKFFRAGTDIEITPEISDDGYLFRYSDLFDSSVDIIFNLEDYAYIGAVTADISGCSEITVLTENSTIATTGESIIPIGQETNVLTLRIRGNVTDINIGTVDIYGIFSDGNDEYIFPRPKSIKTTEKRVRISGCNGNDADEAYAARFLSESLNERYGFTENNDGVIARFAICSEY